MSSLPQRSVAVADPDPDGSVLCKPWMWAGSTSHPCRSWLAPVRGGSSVLPGVWPHLDSGVGKKQQSAGHTAAQTPSSSFPSAFPSGPHLHPGLLHRWEPCFYFKVHSRFLLAFNHIQGSSEVIEGDGFES